MVKSTFRETILIICLLPGPYNMAYEKIGHTITRLPVCPFSRLLVCPFARLPVCPFARFTVWPFAHLPVWLFGRLAVWPFVSGVIWISTRPLTIYIYPIAIDRISIFK